MSLLASILSPSGIAILLALLGLLARVWRRRPGLSWGLLAASAAVTLVFSSGMVAAALMSPLEYAYPTIKDPRAYPQAHHIVVLTAWASEDPEMPLTGRLNASAGYRVMLALEFTRMRPDCEVIVSGDEITTRVMSQALLELGLAPDRLRTAEGGRSTAYSAQLLSEKLHDEPFFLVTSAGHMPRSMQLMSHYGLRAIPAPTDHQLPRDWRKAEWQPSPFSLLVSDLAVHEHLSRLWYRLKLGEAQAARPAASPSVTSS